MSNLSKNWDGIILFHELRNNALLNYYVIEKFNILIIPLLKTFLKIALLL